MATGSRTTPPPSYEDGKTSHLPIAKTTTTIEAKGDNQGSNDKCSETIPKSTELLNEQNMPSNQQNTLRSESHVNNNKLFNQVNQFNKHHSCVPHSGRRKLTAGSAADQHLKFIDSLSARRRFLSNVTIEPLAFLAILALFIEFPSIQDLIYTKICLQVVANHPNFTTRFEQIQVSVDFPSQSTKSLDKIQQNSNSSISFNLTTNLSDQGRIQQSTNITASLIGQIPRIAIDEHKSIDHVLCDRYNKSAIPASIRQEIIDGDSLFWLKYQLVICLLCTLSCPYWGGMSDKIGRLIPLNVPIVAAIVSNVISITFGLLISLDSHTLFHVNWLYIGAVLTGLSGGQAILILNSFSFISDNTSSESRSKRITVLESAIYLAHSVGFYVTKHIMSIGLARPERPWLNRHFVAFLTCVSLNLICVFYSIIKLRHHKFHRFLNNFEREQQESCSGDVLSISTATAGGSLERLDAKSVSSNFGSTANVDRQRELTASTPDDLDGPVSQADRRWSDWGAVLTFKYYQQTFETLTKARESRTMIWSILLCGFISSMSLATLMSLLFIYLRTDPFNWTTSQYSSWNSITSITRGAALVALTISMNLMKNWNIPDPLVAAIGFLSKGLGLTMIAIARSSDLINWSLVALIFSEFSMPPIRSILSKLVVKEEVGKVYSCLATLQSICFLFGNIIFYLAYTSLGLQNFFSLSFLVVACLQFSAVIIMLLVYGALRQRVVIV